MRRRGIICLAGLLCLLILAGCGEKEGYASDGYAEGRMGDTMHTCFFDYTVNSAYLCDEYEGYTAVQDGFCLLVADVTVKNTFQETIPMFDSDFQVQWGDDDPDAFDFPITYYGDAVSENQLPTEYDLAIDETQSGLLVYEVPEGEKDFSISYLEAFEDGSEGDVFFVYFTAEEQQAQA